MDSIPGTSLTLQENVPARTFTSLALGGPCRFLAKLRNREDLGPALKWGQDRGVEVVFLGEGSNVLFADSGFPGLVIINQLRGRTRKEDVVEAGSGESLHGLIGWMNRKGLGGMERMYGIPGSVAGALVGNAGAYGQEIADCVLAVEVFGPSGPELLNRERLAFRYRHSALKDSPDLYVLRGVFRVHPGSQGLQKCSEDILRIRERKYPRALRCPGSFFKNVLIEETPPEVLDRIPPGYVSHGRIPAGRLLEGVGANGMSLGGAQVATYHGNLLINRNNACTADMLDLAHRLAERVWDRYGIVLEPEVRIVAAPGETPFPIRPATNPSA
jgi:UDP-N-acetylmuramate dehydrogenase